MTFVTTQPNEQARWRSLFQKFNPLRCVVRHGGVSYYCDVFTQKRSAERLTSLSVP